MSVQYLTRELKTGEIMVMSHVTSIEVIGEKISLLQNSSNNGSEASANVHLTFEVVGDKTEPCILSNAEELGLIFEAEDAVKIGLSLVAMGLKNKTDAGVSQIRERLSEEVQLLLENNLIPLRGSQKSEVRSQK